MSITKPRVSRTGRSAPETLIRIQSHDVGPDRSALLVYVPESDIAIIVIGKIGGGGRCRTAMPVMMIVKHVGR